MVRQRPPSRACTTTAVPGCAGDRTPEIVTCWPAVTVVGAARPVSRARTVTSTGELVDGACAAVPSYLHRSGPDHCGAPDQCTAPPAPLVTDASVDQVE